LLICGVTILLLALLTPYVLPTWDEKVAPFLWKHRLFGGALLLCLLFALLWKLPKWQVASVKDEKDRVTAESGFRQTLAQIVGGAALLIGLYFTAQTLKVSREGQITDRFSKAIAQLGDTSLAVRLGGIYALERITKDSETDHWAVMEVLTAFVREYSHGRPKTLWERVFLFLVKDQSPEDGVELKPAADIQAVLTVIGRREKTYGDGEIQRLDLSNANLQGAILTEAQLQGAILWKAQLQGADLWKAQLQGAKLVSAQLQGAKLVGAQLQKALLLKAKLKGAFLTNARLEGADLSEAEVTDDQIPMSCGDENTTLPREITTQPRRCPTQ
jgi:hypothetical protein